MDTGSLKSRIDNFIEAKFIPLGTKQKVAILIALLAVPIAAFAFLVYSPKQKEIKGLVGKLAQLEKELAEVKAASAKFEQYKAELAQTELRFKEASLLLPQQKEIPSLLTNISSLGTQAGLDFLSFQPRAEVAQEFYAEIPVDISIRGPYHNVGIFLYEISKLPRIVSVANLRMGSPTPTEEGEMLLNSDFTLITYRFLESSSDNNTDAQKGKQKKG